MPPVERWNPELSGEMDMIINREGHWIHEGEKIERKQLVKLFTSILKRAGDDYFLVTPVEKWKIAVQVAPLVILEANRSSDNSVVVMKTSVDNQIILSASNPLSLKKVGDETLPFVTVQRGFEALVHRNVFYQLVDWAEPEESPDGITEMVLLSSGGRFSLGKF